MKKIVLVLALTASITTTATTVTAKKIPRTYMKCCMATRNGFDTEDNESFIADIPLAKDQMFMGVFDSHGTKTVKDDQLKKIILIFDEESGWN